MAKNKKEKTCNRCVHKKEIFYVCSEFLYACAHSKRMIGVRPGPNNKLDYHDCCPSFRPKGTNKSSKGGAFERFMAKDISLWWSNGERDDIFWRTSGSGARATTRRKSFLPTANSYGDLGTDDPIGKPLTDLILFEFKKGYSKEIQILSFLDLPKRRGAIEMKDPILLRWWKKAEEERQYAKRKFVNIIFRRDDKEIVVMCSEGFMFHLRVINKSLERPPIITYRKDLSEEGLCFIKYEDWKKYVSIENINEELKRQNQMLERLTAKPLKRVKPC
jgi:hypothetical protein